MSRWKHHIKNGKKLRKAINDDDNVQTLEALKECYKEINRIMVSVFDDDDLEDILSEIDNQLDNCKNYEDYDMTEDDVQDEINYLLKQFYDFCDDWRIWVDLI